MQSEVVMTDLERAMADIAFIQQRLAASTRFDGLTPQAVAGTGLLALAAAFVQAHWPVPFAETAFAYIAVWSIVALIAVGLIGGEALIRARRLHGSMADMLIASTLRLLLPFMVAGGALALIVLRFAPQSAWMLPGLWQMLIALAGFCSVSTLPRAIVWAAGWYFASAVVTLIVGAQTQSLDPWMMGVPFGIGQIAVAAVLQRATRETI